MAKKSWQEVAALAQSLRDKSIADIQPPITMPESLASGADDLPLNTTSLPRQILSEAEIKITETPPEELVRALAAGEVSCVDVTSAFLRRAGVAQKLTNCVTEVLPTAAMQRAKQLDDHLATHKTPIGPLHGLPISVKEHIGIKGLGLNGGFVGWWDHVAQRDAHIVALLQSAGAVVYVRTTQPQCLMHLETHSNLYGATVNPYNRALTCGGSSGGEGALIALHGSPLGIGTDIGGSIRSPAANCGIWGFRPSTYRLPPGGCTAPMAGQEQIVPVIGPLSASFEGCHLFMKTLIDQKPWLVDPSLLPMPWRYELPSPSAPGKESSHLRKPDGQRRLKVAILWSDGVVNPHPPVERALREIATKLSTSAHADQVELVDWKPLQHDLAWDIISSLYFCDGAAQDSAAIASSGEPWLPLSDFIVHEQPGVKEYSISEVWQLTQRREEYRAMYAQLWNASGSLKKTSLSSTTSTSTSDDPVDVILCPVGPGAAPPLNHARYWGYTSQWNLLDYPAMVFPVTQVDAQLDLAKPEYTPLNEQDAWNHALYDDPSKYADAPVSLQLVGRRYEDEKVFEAMAWIRELVGGELPLQPFK